MGAPTPPRMHTADAKNFMTGPGWDRRCAECGHFYEEHVNPRTFCTCCTTGTTPLPSHGGLALGFRDRAEWIPGSAGTVQGAEFPKHLKRWDGKGGLDNIVVHDPDQEAAAAAQGYRVSVKELGPSPVSLSKKEGTLDQRMALVMQIEEMLADVAAPSDADPGATLARVIAERDDFAHKLASATEEPKK